MQNNSSGGGWYINDFHRANSMAAQREVQRMSLHPYSREQKLEQIASIRRDIRINTPELKCGGKRNLTLTVASFE